LFQVHKQKFDPLESSKWKGPFSYNNVLELLIKVDKSKKHWMSWI
jgi:hypothetical protein